MTVANRIADVRLLLTGADGFIGRNFEVRVAGRSAITLYRAVRDTTDAELRSQIAAADVIVHLAGCNRPNDIADFAVDNSGLSARLAETVRMQAGPRKHILFSSSIQAVCDNPYGRSKLHSETVIAALADDGGADVAIFRLPNVFGKWARPQYNSAVATFCHAAAHGQPLPVNDPASPLSLVYIDDVVTAMLDAVDNRQPGLTWPVIAPCYTTTVGEVAATIAYFARTRLSLGVGRVGAGLPRALYATFLAALAPVDFAYPVPVYGDHRGRFVEAVKTLDSGQLSYFTQAPGVIRGGHYHDTKSEKFLVLAGHARFRFRHLVSGDRYAIDVTAAEPKIVDTIPGWAHDVVNLGDNELIVLVWANEVFDRAAPDTVATQVDQCAA